jgi:hypothetical protein
MPTDSGSTLRLWPVAAALLLALTLAACGGGSGEPAATAVEEPTEGLTGEPTGAEPTEPIETGEPGAALPFDSFHYVVDLEFVIDEPNGDEQSAISGRVEGDYVAPDSHSFVSRFEFGGIGGSQEIVLIDDDAWYRQGGGAWRATTASDPDVADAIDLTSADPDFIYDPEFASDLAAIDSETETVAGVQTRRYFIPQDAVDTLAQLLGPDFLSAESGLLSFEMTVWLEEESGALVKAELSATGTPALLGTDFPLEISADATISISLTLTLSRINDPSIEVGPPA